MTAIHDANERVLLWITDLVGKYPLLDGLMRLMANDYFMPVSMSLVLLGLWFAGQNGKDRERNQMTVFTTAVAIGLATALVKVCNLFWGIRHAPRPFMDSPQLLDHVQKIFYLTHDPSLPSNMAAITFAIAAAVWVNNRKTGYLLFLGALLVSFARVFAAAHYPLDILAGAALGILCAFVAHKVMMRILDPMFKFLLRVGRKFCFA
jgi:undecaprenyl-diphosphatase